ncbi:MAG: DnaJ domain-containing protein [Alphaproteobacteria bacterium]|nr:DnaJ domain-containing protein [Alphaproteobacteria bacterium]
MQNPYELLGVSKTATATEIKKAYHKLARSYHPDINPDKKAAEKFKSITAAYELLSDPQKRKQFDAGEIDANGNPTPFGAGAYDNAFRNNQSRYSTHHVNPEDFASMFSGGFSGFGTGRGFDFSDLFGMGSSHTKHTDSHFRQQQQNNDMHYELAVPFDLAITGGETTITVNTGKRLKVKIPAGVTTDSVLRLKKQGKTGFDGQVGDALITIKVQNSNLFTREGDNIRVNVPISLKEAVLGGKIPVPTPYGVVMMTIPPYTDSGKTLRLKGKGVKDKGDLFVSLQIMLPEKHNKALTDFMQQWDEPYQNLKRG